MVNLYEILGLSQNCSGVEIRRSIAKHQADGTMTEQQIKAVKPYLLDSENRAKYDKKLSELTSNNATEQIDIADTPEIYQYEQYPPMTLADYIVGLGFLASIVFFGMSLYKMHSYNPYMASDRHVGGDAYNLIINAGHATTYAVISAAFLILSFGILIYREVKK